MNASGDSVHHQWNSVPPAPQSRRFHSRTVDVTYPYESVSSMRRRGSCQQTSGFQSSGRSSASRAARWSAHPAPPGNPGRLRNTQASSISRVTCTPSSLRAVSRRGLMRSNICHCSGVRRAARSLRFVRSAASTMWAPCEQQPWDSSVVSTSWVPLQPRPKMHDQPLVRNVTSKTQVRSATGSSKLISSCMSSGRMRSFSASLTLRT